MKNKSNEDGKGNYISKCMSRGLTNKQARQAWKNRDKSKVWCKLSESYVNPINLDNEKSYDFDSDINSNGTNWHTSEDL